VLVLTSAHEILPQLGLMVYILSIRSFACGFMPMFVHLIAVQFD